MLPDDVRFLFWDVDLEAFDPRSYPDYTISRVLELGDKPALVWLKSMFSEDEIRRVLLTERRLSRRSATFWALVYRLPPDQVPALKESAGWDAEPRGRF